MEKVYKILSLLTFTFILTYGGLAQNAWINEFHYDNDGGDVDEMIEVVIENPGSYTLSLFEVYLYNGNGGATYAPTYNLSEFTAGATVGNFTIFYKMYPVNGIQNGAPDGLALVYNGAVISGQWLSYEGSFAATNGPANGTTSVDIGVMEPSTTPIGQSLQLTGTGTQYGDFSWEPPATATPGDLNNGQTIGGAPLPEPSSYPTDLAASVYKIQITLDWTDATGAQLPSKYLVLLSDADNITAPVDGTPVADDTDFSDGNGALNINYGVQTCSFYPLEGQTEYFFKIYPYTNAGANINYKTDGTAPAISETTVIRVHFEDFESNSFGSWTTFSVASDKDWAVVNFGGAYNTTFFAQMNGFSENEPSNDWLISPSLDLTVNSNEQLEFFTIWRYGDTDTELKLKYSTDYTAGDPTAATWTELTFIKPSVQDTWTSSGDVSLAGISGTNVHLAFQYLSSGNPRRWGVDEILVTEGPIVPALTVTNPYGGEYWEQGTAHDITWSASNTLSNVMIELTTNASAGSPTWTVLNASVPAAQGTWTWNISPTQTTSSDCQIRITDFAADVTGLSGIFSVVEPIYIPQLVITEIMYNPPESGTDSLEFIELYNNDIVAIDLEGYYFSDGVTFTFPAMTMNPGEYLVLATNAAAFEGFFGFEPLACTGALSNSGELLLLRNNYNMVVDSVLYDDAAPWPTDPDGFGPSLRFCDPGLDNSIPDYWGSSIEFAGLISSGDTVWASPGAGCANWPSAEFSADITVVTTGSSVQFTDESTGDPTLWVWTFIGGTPGSYVGQTPPAVVYNTPGSYDVVLYVENAAGTSTKVKTDYIQVGSAPAADFSASPTSLYAGETVDFTDLTANGPETWEWSFEGGTPSSSTEQNPADILYSTPGIYAVTLTVTNMFGTDTLTKETYIDVLPVGIGEKNDPVMQVYPNPNRGSFNLNNISGEPLRMTVSSLVGKTLYESSVSPGMHHFNLSDLGKGMFLINMRNDKGNVTGTQKIMIF